MKKQWYNDEDELYDRKQMRNWPAKKEFHDENDKRIAELEKQKKDKESKKDTNFTVGPKNPAGRLKMTESQLREMVSKIIRESLEEMGAAQTGGQYMAILQKNGFQPMQSEDDTSWIQSPGLYFTILTPQGWFHSKIYRCNEGVIFNVAERLSNALKAAGWIEDAVAAAQNSPEYDSEYTTIAYIEDAYEGEYDDNGERTGDGISIDTCGSFVVDRNGFGFWND